MNTIPSNIFSEIEKSATKQLNDKFRDRPLQGR